MKHSPGKWVVRESDSQWDIVSEGGSGYCITSISKDDEYGEPEEDPANAFLLAAAPELLEMTKLLKKTLEAIKAGPGNTAFDEVERLIAKAEGK